MSNSGLQKKHWLIHVIRRAGVPGSEACEIEPGAPAAEAWQTVTDKLGVTMDQLAGYVSDYFRLAVAELDGIEATAATKLVPEKVARQYNIFPVRVDDRQLVVATADPTNFTAEQALGFSSGRKAVFEVAPPPYILDAINGAYTPDGMIESLLSSVDESMTSAVSVLSDPDDKEVAKAAEDAATAPVIKLTNLILRDAAMNGASDVHIEPGAAGGTVRFRVDGVLRNYMQLPLPALVRVISRIKILGNLDIADRWRPQDGRTRILVEGRPYDIRISTVPTRGTEKAVLRLLRSGEAHHITDIGLQPWELGRLRQLLSNRDGIVCVTGPTGSGKTTTLYAAIRDIATGEVNIMTVEDPVEYELSGITQIQVQTKRGVTFASALRAILRQDPDVILVGEIRDLETAEVAVQAAMTGHLVLATLHTNDAVSVVSRMLDIGLDRASVSSTLRGSLAQRLVRKLCDECAEPIRGEMTEDEIRLAKQFNVRPAMRAVGCRRCADIGYRGRLPLQEVMVVNTQLQDLIAAGASQSELQNAAMAGGMRTLLTVGLERVRTGETTLDELERVLGLEADEAMPEDAEAEPIEQDRSVRVRSQAETDAPPEAPESEAPEPTDAAGTLSGAGIENGAAAVDGGAGEARSPGPVTDPASRSADAAGAGTIEGDIPAAGDVAGPQPTPLARPARQAAGTGAGPPTTSAPASRDESVHILVVDDAPEDRLLARTLLRKHGYQVSEASDGREALDMIQTNGSYSLVVLDLDMPNLGGREALKQLRESISVEIPVVVLTSSPNPEDEYRLMEGGADDYLRKPIDPPRFIARVKAALRRARIA